MICTPVSFFFVVSSPLFSSHQPKHSPQHTQPFNGPLSGTTRVSLYQKGKTNLDFTEARDSEWHWHQLGHMQVCTSLQTDNHASTPPLSFLQAGCHSCRPTNSIKAVKGRQYFWGFFWCYIYICHNTYAAPKTKIESSPHTRIDRNRTAAEEEN